MSFFISPVSIAKSRKKLTSRFLAILVSILLASCGGGGGSGSNNNPPPGGETPTETNTAVWDEGNWDQVNWQ